MFPGFGKDDFRSGNRFVVIIPGGRDRLAVIAGRHQFEPEFVPHTICSVLLVLDIIERNGRRQVDGDIDIAVIRLPGGALRVEVGPEHSTVFRGVFFEDQRIIVARILQGVTKVAVGVGGNLDVVPSQVHRHERTGNRMLDGNPAPALRPEVDERIDAVRHGRTIDESQAVHPAPHVILQFRRGIPDGRHHALSGSDQIGPVLRIEFVQHLFFLGILLIKDEIESIDAGADRQGLPVRQITFRVDDDIHRRDVRVRQFDRKFAGSVGDHLRQRRAGGHLTNPQTIPHDLGGRRGIQADRRP